MGDVNAEPPSLTDPAQRPARAGPPKNITKLDLASLPWASKHHLHLNLFRDPAGQPLRVSVLFVRGAKPRRHRRHGRRGC
jgi:uncharacterized protein